MSQRAIPNDLVGYNIARQLDQWVTGTGLGTGRQYFVSAWRENSAECRLTWRFGDNQMGAIRKVANSAEEAVWLALKEFDRWVTSVEKEGEAVTLPGDESGDPLPGFRPIEEQKPPQPSTGDVWLFVLKDMEERRVHGIQKYGAPVQPHNGRDALVDLYQELLDACVYIRQAIAEEEEARLEAERRGRPRKRYN